MPTPSKKPKTPRKPSPTARILENVETMLELMNSQDQGSSDVGELLDEKANEITSSLESQIEKRFNQLETKLRVIGKTVAVKPVKQDTNLNESIETLESQIDKRLGALESRIEERLSGLTQSLETIANKETKNTDLAKSEADLANLLDEKALEIADSIETQIGKRFGELESQLENISQSAQELAKDSQLDEKDSITAAELSELLEASNEKITAALKNQSDQRFSKIESQLEKFSQSAQELAKDNQSDDKDSVTSAELSELLENSNAKITAAVKTQSDQRFTKIETQLRKLCKPTGKAPQSEDVANLLEQSTAAITESLKSEIKQLDEKTNKIKDALKAQNEKRFTKLESLVEKSSKANGKSTKQDNTAQNKSLDEFAKRLESEFDQRFELLESYITENSTTSSTDSPTSLNFDSRFEELNSQFEKLAESVLTQKESLERASETSLIAYDGEREATEHRVDFENTIQDMTEQFSQKTDAIAATFNAQIELMFDSLGSRVARISEGVKQQEANLHSNVDPRAEVAEPEIETVSSDSDSASHWHRQKEAMLSKYGIDPEHRPVMELAETEIAPTTPATAQPENTSDTPQSMSEIDAAEIAEMKDQLNSKLRDAEIELSINRAKLSQQQAKMENLQVELDRRSAAIEEKYAAVKNNSSGCEKRGFLDRLTRHLRTK